MGDIGITISTIEDLYQFLNDDGILEIVTRHKNKKFKEFYKIAIDKAKQPETQKKLQETIEYLSEKNELLTKTSNAIGKCSDIFAAANNLNRLTLVFNGMNLCASCVGFAIMYEKLDELNVQITAQINRIIEHQKEIGAIQTNYKYKQVLSEHSNMLDCRKKQNNYSEDKMRELVSAEYDLLDMLTEVYLKDVTNDQDLLFTILSLAAMLAVSVKYFDEVYYFKNKAAIGNGDVWHLDHEKWVSAFDKLEAPEFVEKIQDYGLLDLGLNTTETDSLYLNFCGQIKGLKQEIRDNQTLIQAIDDAELFGALHEKINDEIRDEIRAAMQTVGLNSAICEEAIRIAVA